MEESAFLSFSEGAFPFLLSESVAAEANVLLLPREPTDPVLVLDLETAGLELDLLDRTGGDFVALPEDAICEGVPERLDEGLPDWLAASGAGTISAFKEWSSATIRGNTSPLLP